jgi:SAM-dependent methyltransferase
MSKPWMLDELAHAGPEHLDPAFVAGYERKQGYPDPTEDLAVLTAHGLDATSTVVDLGAGTGRFALAAARRFGQVTAVDIAPAMLAVLRRRAAAAGVANLECVQAGFLSYRHAGPPADAVYTRNALHQLPDFWKAVALDRVRGMLRPGGVLRLPALGGRRGVRPVAGGRRRRSGPGLHRRGLRRAHPHRAQHLPLAVGADAGRRRLPDPDRAVQRVGVRRLHLPQTLSGSTSTD